MTRNKPAPKARARKPARTRGVPIQVYVSKREHAALAALARTGECSISELIRAWLDSARAARRAARPTPAEQLQDALRQAADPRQLDIGERLAQDTLASDGVRSPNATRANRRPD